ncbi:MAG TPA: PAS domain S-box protein [Methanospirillum sp.]|uniref:PAS domain-containing protein n=1 Tax=Methanospirillum sp. TaxID=45200 RepID=UPI002BE33081|nr:PAS domain S-box protein [Methanospirillum sp.]HWQ63980.1 PAS domain S-box protein [Methanospirillum sp.]
MPEHFEKVPDWKNQRQKIIGLGESSVRKNYFPELQERLIELENVNQALKERTRDLESLNAELLAEVQERRSMEEALRESEERFRAVFENANDAIYLYDFIPDMFPVPFLNVNRKAYELLGYTYDEMLCLTPWDILAENCWNKYREQVIEVYENGHAMYEVIHITRTGEKIPMEVSSHLFTFRGRKLLLSIARDISDRKKNEQKMREAISQIDMNMGTLATLNDKIRNPLTIIDILSEEIEPQRREQIYEQILAIDKIIDELDKGWIESEKVRNYLRRHHDLYVY